MNLKKWLSDESLVIPLNEIDSTTSYTLKNPVKIINHEVKQLKQSRISIVIGTLDKEPNLLESENINSKPSTHTFSPPHRLLSSPVELWGPEFL
ncbi:hypothetical protein Tco_0064822 [Tanacetum coccineum]